MKGKRFTEEQIAFALRQVEGGIPVKEVCRKLQISEQTFSRWKKKFGGPGVPQARCWECGWRAVAQVRRLMSPG